MSSTNSRAPPPWREPERVEGKLVAALVVVVAVVILGHWATRSFEDHVQAVALVGLVTTGALLGIVTLASLGSSSWVRLALR